MEPTAVAEAWRILRSARSVQTVSVLGMLVTSAKMAVEARRVVHTETKFLCSSVFREVKGISGDGEKKVFFIQKKMKLLVSAATCHPISSQSCR